MTISTPKPTPTTLTLRLKFHRTSVLLHADPLLSVSALKSDLLHAVRDTHPDNRLHGRPLPSSPTDLQLARMVDPADPDQGWVAIEDADSTPEGEEDEEAAEPKKKGDGRAKGKSAAGDGGSGGDKNLKESAIKDGMVLAFRWGGEVERDGETETLDWEDWDVVWPRYEDAYGLEDEGIVE